MGFAATYTLQGLRRAIGEFVAGAISLNVLDELVIRMGEFLPSDDDLRSELWGQVELLLAEHSAGDLDDDELRADLATLAPVPVNVGPSPSTVTTTGSGARTVLTSLGLLLPLASPVADRRSVAALL